MVTGAGGSIGAELCRQIARFRPALLVFFEQSEYALYRLQQEFDRAFRRHPSVVGGAATSGNRLRTEYVLRRYKPDVVFHAAAYKHVPLMEEGNAWEAVRNNVWGTYVTGQALRSPPG